MTDGSSATLLIGPRKPPAMRLTVALLAAPFLLSLLAGCSDSGDADRAGGLDADNPRIPSVRPASVWPPIQQLMADVPCEAEVGGDTSSNLVQLSSVKYGTEHDAEEGVNHAELAFPT